MPRPAARWYVAAWSTPVFRIYIGEEYGDDVNDWTGDTLTIMSTSAASGERTFTRADALP